MGCLVSGLSELFAKITAMSEWDKHIIYLIIRGLILWGLGLGFLAPALVIVYLVILDGLNIPRRDFMGLELIPIAIIALVVGMIIGGFRGFSSWIQDQQDDDEACV